MGVGGVGDRDTQTEGQRLAGDADAQWRGSGQTWSHGGELEPPLELQV